MFFVYFIADLIVEHHKPELENESLSYLLHDLPDYLVHARTDNTVKTYSSGFRQWKNWSLTHSTQHLPGNPLSFSLYILALVQNDENVTKIKSIFYSVKFFHKTLHLLDPTENSLAQEMLEVAKRLCRKTSKKKKPLKIEDIKEIHSKFKVNGSMFLQNQRTFTMILLRVF